MPVSDCSRGELQLEAFSIRPGTIADIGKMALVLERANSFRNSNPLPETVTDQAALERLKGRMAWPNAWSFITDAPDRMAGFVLVHPSLGEVTLEATQQSRPDVEHLALLMTEPRYWGKGIGTKLLDIAAENARDNGKEQMILWTARNNIRARRLYEHNGYVLSNRTRVSEFRGPLVQYILDL